MLTAYVSTTYCYTAACLLIFLGADNIDMSAVGQLYQLLTFKGPPTIDTSFETNRPSLKTAYG